MGNNGEVNAAGHLQTQISGRFSSPFLNPRHYPNNAVLTITLGNYLILDLGGGNYGLYAHLQPGTLRVKAGDRVKRGQTLGLVGNSGSSTEPHLHFQVMNGTSLLDPEGVPYLIDSFELLSGPNAGRQTDALPMENMLVKFGPVIR